MAAAVPTHGLTRDEVRFGGLRLCEAVHPPALCIPRHEHDLVKVCILLAGTYAERDGPDLRSMWPMDVLVRGSRRGHANQYGATGARSLLLEIPPDHAKAAALERIDSRRLASEKVMQAAAGLVRAFYDPSCSRLMLTRTAIHSLLEAIVRNARMNSRPRWLDATRERLSQSFTERFVLSELAAQMGVHPVHLSHSFRVHFGQTLTGYLRALRVFHATELLQSDADISSIAIDCGFYDQSHFTRAFHRERGTPPRAVPASDRGLGAPALRRCKTGCRRTLTVQSVLTGDAVTAALVMMLGLGCSTSRLGSPSGPPRNFTPDPLRFDLSGIDRSVDPCLDFYAYACGGWRATHPIPPDKSRISRYDEMIDRNEAWTRELLENASDQSRVHTPLERQVGDDYASCLDEVGVDALGQKPLRQEIDWIDRALDAGDWTELFARLHKQDVRAPFSIFALEDIRSPDRMLLQIDVGGMGLRSRDDYLREDEHSKRLRAAYQSYLQRLLSLLGESGSSAEALASRVLAMETSLARTAPDPLTRRSRELLYHPTAIQQLEEQAPSIRWRDYFQKLGARVDTLRINVTAPAFLGAVESLIRSADRPFWRAFLLAHLIRRSIDTLPSQFISAHFDFYGSSVRGLRELPPRWKRCVRVVNEHLGEAVGQLFVREHFSPQARARVLNVIQAVRDALRERIEESSWMSEPTRREVLQKADAITVKVGHPDRWRDYSALEIVRGDAFGNGRRARQFEMRRQMSKLNRPTDRLEWNSLPQELDGYSTKVLNEIALTAGILQRPFFDPSADAALQFGALGAVAGHELIHLFDDQGRKFDAHGALREWWTPQDARRYREIAQCFVDQYARETGLGELHVNGQLTLGENLADNGGMRLAHRALKPDPSGPVIEGFTPLQRFFLAWAQIRCENTTDAALRQQLQSDGHSPGRQRVNVVASNMTEFASAFGCRPRAPMAPEDRCVLW